VTAYPQSAAECAEVFRMFPEWTRDEIADLSDEQLGRTGPEKWAEWSPLRQLSHVSYITTRWYMVLFGAAALSWRPVDMSQFGTFINSPEDDRRFSASRYGDPEWLLERLGEACVAAAERLDGEAGSPEDGEVLLFVFGRDADIGATDEKTLALWGRNVECHPDGATFDAARGEIRLALLATLRHLIWDNLIHLRSIRMHRKAMGLAPAHPETPAGGYAPAYPVR
jgi:hypothetical protein